MTLPLYTAFKAWELKLDLMKQVEKLLDEEVVKNFYNGKIVFSYYRCNRLSPFMFSLHV
jgi:hypothetical protein